MEKINQSINFYKPPFRKIPKKFSGQKLVSGCVLTGLVLTGASFFMQKSIERDTIKIASNKQKIVAIKSETNNLKSEIQNLLNTQQNRLENDYEVVKSVNEELKRRLQIYEKSAGRFFVNEISGFYSALGRQAVDGLWLENFELSPAAGRVAISGKATSPALIPEYVAKLTADNAFKGFNFHAADIKKDDDENIITFKLQSIPEETP